MPSPCSVFSMPGPMPLIFFRSSGSPSGEGSAGGGVPWTGSAGGAAAPVAAGSELACRVLAARASLSSCSSRAMRSRPLSSACFQAARPAVPAVGQLAELGQGRLEPALRLARRGELRAQTIGFVREARCHAAVRSGAAGHPADHEPERRGHQQEDHDLPEQSQGRSPLMRRPPARRRKRLRSSRAPGLGAGSARLERLPGRRRRPSVPETRPDQPLRGACLCHFLVARSSATGVH